MDTSEQYIKMCEKAVEVQKAWKPARGDSWACPCESCLKNRADIRIVQDFDIDALEGRDLTNVVSPYKECVEFYGGHFVDHLTECREIFVWLPRQDQLQEMVDIPILNLIFHFIKFLKLHTEYGYHISSGLQAVDGFICLDSMEQLWLAFVREELHGKVWNGEDWESSGQ